MKFTCYFCVAFLIILGICGGVFAFSGFNLLLFICFNSQLIYRIFLAQCFIAALFTVYSLLVFKPFKGLK